ncbi:MAG: hypothetical protein WCS09_10150 [Pseudomonadota bacterium]
MSPSVDSCAPAATRPAIPAASCLIPSEGAPVGAPVGRLEWPLLPSSTHVVVPLVAPVQPLH